MSVSSKYPFERNSITWKMSFWDLLSEQKIDFCTKKQCFTFSFTSLHFTQVQRLKKEVEKFAVKARAQQSEKEEVSSTDLLKPLLKKEQKKNEA